MSIYIHIYIYIYEYILYIYIYIYIYIWIKKTHNLLKITNISLLFRSFINDKASEKREIFVILSKLCVFLIHIFQVTHL